MSVDLNALTSYNLKRQLLPNYFVYNPQKKLIIVARKKIFANEIDIYEAPSSRAAFLKINWKAKKGLVLEKFFYTISERGRNVIASVECERAVVFTAKFIVKDQSGREIAVIQPDEVGYTFGCLNIIMGTKKVAAFYRNSDYSLSYVMDLSGDKEKLLERKLALGLAVILANQGLFMHNNSVPVDWDKPVATGDEMYKIKRGLSA